MMGSRSSSLPTVLWRMAGWHRKSSCLLPNQSNDGLLLTSTQGQGRSWSTANDIHFERPLYLSTCTGSLFCPSFHVWSIFQLSLWEEVGNDEAGVSTLHPLLPLLCLLILLLPLLLLLLLLLPPLIPLLALLAPCILQYERWPFPLLSPGTPLCFGVTKLVKEPSVCVILSCWHCLVANVSMW